MSISLDRDHDAPPLHVQLAAILRARIRDGVWKEGEPLPTEKTLCAEFDVARGTLRQALQKLEAEGYLRREQGRGTFVQVAGLRQPARDAPSARLAFIVPYVRDSSVSNILMGFQEAAEQGQFVVVFSHVNNDARQQDALIERLAGEGISGIALYPVDSESPAPLAGLIRSGYPIVLIDRYLKDVPSDYVGADHFGGALSAVHYLAEQGHRRIGFVTWRSPATSMEHRHLGYLQALRERGLPVDSALMCTVEGYPTVDLTPLKTYLSEPERPTAVFAANDQIAIALYRAAQAVGLRVPHDLSITGFDDLDIVDRLDPPLTTIAQPFQDIGRAAAKLLARRIRGERGYVQHLTIPPQLIVRESVAPPANDLTPAPSPDRTPHQERKAD